LHPIGISPFFVSALLEGEAILIAAGVAAHRGLLGGHW